jgi:putative Mg2+ transporter-C (MgtC) family protein
MTDLAEPILRWPDVHLLILSAGRLALAALFGGILGFQRERVHSTAGLRTHMLVCVGSAFFVLTAIESGAAMSDVSRIIQGLVAGIGFLGAGTILKIGDRAEVHGLTTAASIWLTAAVGTGVGLGHVWLPIAGAILGWIILGPLERFEKHGKIGAPPKA